MMEKTKNKIEGTDHTIFFSSGVSGMVLVKNKHTGKTFDLTPEEIKDLHHLLSSVLSLTVKSSNPPSDQL